MSQQSLDFGTEERPQDMSQRKFLVGTSGYSFQDWKGTFYPATIQNRDMLPYYAGFFSVAEINATYYRIPGRRTFEAMLKKVRPGFEFVVKTHQDMTHSRKAGEGEYRIYAESIAPLVDSGQLSGLLAQFPWSFQFSEANADYLLRMRDNLPSSPLVVEFRHASWLRDETYDLFRREGLVYCCVDEPRLKGLLPSQEVVTSDNVAYVRLHGRNAKHWWQGGALRYDYSYSEEQLNEWAERLRRMGSKATKVFVLFNNCHLGQAAQNATVMKEMLQEG